MKTLDELEQVAGGGDWWVNLKFWLLRHMKTKRRPKIPIA